MMEEKLVFKCDCGLVIPEDYIERYGGSSDQGEEYTRVEAWCETCDKSYETSTWGEIDNTQEAIELLNDYYERDKVNPPTLP